MSGRRGAPDGAGRGENRHGPREPAGRPDRPAPVELASIWQSPVLRMLEARSRPAIAMLALLLTAGVGLLDVATGAALAFSVFYLLPVSLAALYGGRRSGLLFATLAAAVWLAADLVAGHVHTHSMVPLWNAAIRWATFAILALALSAIRELLEAERRLARTDQLTGVRNARAFYDLVEVEMSRALRYSRPFTLAYLDVDDFKHINDTRGHTAGDTLLRAIAETLQTNLRTMDSVGRLGGDEFALILPETGPGAAETALNKIRERLARDVRATGSPVTVSMGAVICVGPPATVDELVQLADALMYRVKRTGKNGLAIDTIDEDYEIEAILQRS